MAAKSKLQPNNDPFATPTGPWQDRVDFASNGAPYAYRPAELLCTGEAMRKAAIQLINEVSDNATITETNIYGERYVCSSNEPFNVEAVVARLRQLGFRAEPNYVFFNHGGSVDHRSCGCGACGWTGNPFGGNPFGGNPFGGNPFGGNPFGGNPFGGNPFGGNPETGERASSARPATKPQVGKAQIPSSRAKAIILDTGIAMKDDVPDILQNREEIAADARDREEPDENKDGFLDPISGHGTFIAGILEQLAPGQSIQVASVLSTMGDGSAAAIAKRLDQITDSGVITKQTVFNMSFGSYGDVDMFLVSDAIRRVQEQGAIVVSSAGNDNTSLPSFPACLPDVVGVGAIETCGRAPYSNFGCWVRACAPGTDVVSSFFRQYDGDHPPISEGDIDEFDQWAKWSGTSFAAPVVVAALMRHIAMYDTSAEEAVSAVIDSPSLLRYSGLGTVVNLAPGM